MMMRIVLFISLAGLCVLTGCAEGTAGRNLSNAVKYALTPKTNSIETTLRLTDEERQEKVQLTTQDQQTALTAMRAVAAGETQTQSPQPAKQGVRWRDVPVAMRHACQEVEMAIMRTRRSSDGNRIDFALTTIDERPVTFTVHRIDDERVYEAHATVGRFTNDEERASRLVEAFDRTMLELGKKRGFD